MLVVRGKFNRAAIMVLAHRYAKNLWNGNLAKGLKSAWRDAKLEMDEVKEIEAVKVKFNPNVKMQMLYTCENMRMGYATR